MKLQSGKTIDCELDALGRRVGRSIGGALVSTYVHDGTRLIAERRAVTGKLTRFVYGDSTTTPDYMLRDARSYRIFHDALGSPRLVVDASSGAYARGEARSP